MNVPRLFLHLLSWLSGKPNADMAHADPAFDRAPDGMRWIYTAGNTVEADMLRQTLQENGFQTEYVPWSLTGVIGATGSPHIYAPEDEAEAAAEFLNAYLDPKPAPPDGN
jgi:hypothetical protein